MQLQFDLSLIKGYKSLSQIARVLTEDWLSKNCFCLNCGTEKLTQFNNNKPVADFYCNECNYEYELKSKTGGLGLRIVDGAYHTMIKRIQSENNPNFFLLTYDRKNWIVKDLIVIPKHYFVSEIIEQRKPLSETAKRAGWIGCNILLNEIPSTGKIVLIKNSVESAKQTVLNQWKQTCFLSNIDANSKSWLIDIMLCLESIPTEIFNLEDIYKFEKILKFKHPNNNHIKDKIRQQLQLLRDKGFIQFLKRGVYRKTLSNTNMLSFS